ncbi:MAG: SpoIIE family protein phosphatase [Bacteroidia bacterium]
MWNNIHIYIVRCVYITLLSIVTSTCVAQLANVKEYNTETVLNQRYVYGLSQLPNRTLLLSTNEGLVTYDGNMFTNYTTQNGLANDFVTCHIADKQGNVWCGHYQNGVSVWNKNTGAKKLLSAELKNTKVTAISVYYTSANAYNVYVFTMGNGTYVLNNAGKIISHNDTESVVYKATQHNNELFTATEIGVNITNLSTHKTTYTNDSLSGENISAVCAGNNSWYIAFKNNTVYELRNNKLSKIYSCASKDAQLLHLLLYKNELLINTFNQGIVALNTSTYAINNYYTAYYGLNSVLIQSLFVDDESNLWLGTYGSGLIQLHRQQFTNYTTAKNKLLNNVTAIEKSVEYKRMFIAANTTLLEYDDAITQLKNSISLNDKITCLSQNNDTLWIGTENKGTYLYTITTKKLIAFNTLHSLPLQQVNDIKHYRNYTYVATNNGVHIYNNNSRHIKTFTTNEGLLHNNIYNIHIDKIGRVWFAAHGSGVFYLKGNEFVVFKNIAGLNLFNINSITSDSYNTVWIATEGDGVFKYENNNFTNYRTTDGLLNNYCYGITCDNKGGVWVMNRNGLSYKKINQKLFTYLQSNEGVGITNFNLNAFYNYNNEELYWGGENGLVHYSVKETKLLFKTPTLQVYNVLINGKAVPIVNNAIQLPYGKYDVVINYNATTFLQHEKVRYNYILKGLENNWNDNKSNNSSYYPQLTDGNYTYELYATNADGFKTAQPLLFTITIDKPFYKKWWTYVLLILAVGGGVLVFIRYRLQKLTQEREKLQRLVELRTGQLRSEKNNLEITKKELEIINKDMTDSITYAKRIQDAILPKYEKVKLQYENYFVFYAPRDIVSGDFYFHANKFNKNIFIVGDCTGHGVPGGFMSMISNTLINKIIHDINTPDIDPSYIIKELQRNIVEELNQRDIDSASRDGLDIAMCVIDETTQTVLLSSAGRPIYHVSNGTLNEYKGSVFGVGGYDENVKKDYTTHTVNYSTNDCIYLFSDGYADQFGGDNNKKYMSKKLKELFTANAPLPLVTQQHNIATTFINWKGKYKQIDDVIVLGIKL